MDLSQLPLYDIVHPYDFRVGHRYRQAPSGQEHDYTVNKVELIDDRIIVTTFGGHRIVYPAHQIAVTVCDVLEI